MIGQYVTTMADAVPAGLRAKVLARIDDEEMVRLACELIRIPSFTTEETPLAEWLANYLGDRGLPVTVQEIEPGRKQTIARLRGTGGGRSIMLNGHIDIDPLASGWTRDPFDPWVADGGYTDYHDVHVDLEELLCTRVLALTALEATR